PGQFREAELTAPQQADDEVIVRVRACGLDHLDLWLEQGALPITLELPRIPGSEIAGEIAKLGSDVDEWRVGDRVAVQSNLFCGQCEFCVAGEESLCLEGQLLGVQRDGGFAELVKVPGRALVKLPEKVDFVSARPGTFTNSANPPS